jgi:hypothetical protein
MFLFQQSDIRGKGFVIITTTTTSRKATTIGVRRHLAYLGFTFKKRKSTNLYVTKLVEMAF